MSEETLDPDDWHELRRLGHRMLDDMLDHLESIGTRPAWQPVPPHAQTRIQGALPLDETSAADVYADFKECVLPYPNGNIHPRFWGWVQGTGTPLAMLADMLASGLNPNVSGFNQAPVLVEETVLGWLKTIMGFARASTGVLTSGCSMANLIGLATARNALAGFDLREGGLQDPACPRFAVYASSEVHDWARKCMEVLGLGRRALHLIDADSAHRLPVAALRERMRRDRAAGLAPLCILASCGTVNTGAVDDLEALADLAREEDVWLHVDGAFGALARMSPPHAHLVRGLERADSLAFDLHKWMYLPFQVGCVLVRRPGAQLAAFSSDASYLGATGRGVSAERRQFAELGIELTRSFRALKVWMSLKTHGVRRIGRLIGQNIEQARYLMQLVESSRQLRLLAPVTLNIVCFRYEIAGAGDAALNALNKELLLRIQESGAAVPSSVVIGGRFALRVAIVNHRSTRADFDTLIREVIRQGGILEASAAR